MSKQIQESIPPSDDDNVPDFPRMWDAKVFTDNIVLGYALWSGDGEKEFGHAITQIIDYQLTLTAS